MHVLSYDNSSGTLVVRLIDDTLYECFDVPASLVTELNTSESPQQFFNENLWGSRFEHAWEWSSLEALLQYMGEDMLFDPPVTITSRLGDDDTPLHVACVWGDIAAVDLLLDGGADPNARGDCGVTPLYNAVSFGHVRCAERLIAAGATCDDSNELSSSAQSLGLASSDARMVTLFSNTH